MFYFKIFPVVLIYSKCLSYQLYLDATLDTENLVMDKTEAVPALIRIAF